MFPSSKKESLLTTLLPQIDPISDPSQVSRRLLESDLKAYSLVTMGPEVGVREFLPESLVFLCPFPPLFAQRPPQAVTVSTHPWVVLL